MILLKNNCQTAKEKNEMKKLLAMVMALAMVVACFASCGGNTKDTYFIGATGPLTGDAADYGIAVNNGAKLAIDEINAAGGLNGVPSLMR